MYKKLSTLSQLPFAIFVVLVFCPQINAQTKETLVKKFSNGVEIYQRKNETTAIYDYPNISEIVSSSGGKMEKREFAVQKLEVLLRDPASKQEEIIWSQTLNFPKNERAFNYFVVWDVFGKNGKYYVLYFRELELRVETTVKDSGKWSAENDTFLESTSESHNPILESKFIGKNPKVFAKRYFGGMQELIYEWKLKKGKWILIKGKEVKIVPPWFKKKTNRK
jgi:hypothetical protein